MPVNKLGVHALVFSGGTTPAEVDYAIEQTKAAGYDVLELSLQDAQALDTGHARAALEAAGLGVVCSRGLTFDADISSEDTAVVARGAELLRASVQAVHELGGSLLTGALYSAFGNYGRSLTAAGRANAVSVLQDVAREAQGVGMTLGLEVCNRYETNVVNTAEQALALADDIGEDNVTVHLDSYHMNIEEDDFVRPFALVGDRLGYVHIGENHRGYLGSGHLDFTTFFHSLADIGYTGGITFESFSSAVVSQTLSTDLSIWRNLWNDGPALAKHAHTFITNALEANEPH
ncbi:epimerase [Subtercola sp. Z020]|uniref:sugar phosphate isomerase/epimerase family protein n=1 Tax=Subtercola sp. Z020 TaxID=2080582 RepID=UPI000CE85BC8|nr:sugar phosphate isomerase/epimerase family protein [Subtercola sp. Z020]PPF79563.1 epimerase [Subtercola sp. Z020]